LQELVAGEVSLGRGERDRLVQKAGRALGLSREGADLGERVGVGRDPVRCGPV